MRAEVEKAIQSMTQEQAERLIRAFTYWQQLREAAVRERKRVTDTVKGRLAQFEEAMQVGHSTEGDQLLKLTVLEQRWQDLEEARSERREVLKLYKNDLVSAEQKIKDMIVDATSGQMKLFDTDDQGAVVQEEDAQDDLGDDEADELGDDQ